MDERKLARFLGWFSIGPGVTRIVAPGALTRLLGGRTSRPANVGVAIAAVAGVTALDLICSSRLFTNDARRSQDYSHFEQRSGYKRERLGQVLA